MIDGITFHSTKEGRRYQELKLQAHCGFISDLELQPRFDIHIGKKYIAFYKADFRYKKDGETIIEDTKSKGTLTPVYRLKKKLVEAIHKVEITEVF